MLRRISKSVLTMFFVFILLTFLTNLNFAQQGIQEFNLFQVNYSGLGDLKKSPIPDKNLDKKLNKLRKYINDILKESKVPGLALGIVKDGKVVLAEGFGYRNLEKKLLVTSKTLFAIGSCSKAFTTMAIGMLSEEGKVDWDKPVRTYLPAFTLKDDYITAKMTVRDLVTHRSGLPRHDALWYGSPLTRKEIFDRLRYLEFSAGFREKYQYNNLMFMTAGYLVGQTTGSTWEKFIANRIFKPLGMNGSNFSVKVSEKSSDFAQPYSIKDEKVEKIPFRNIDEIGPAGSINSCIDDMLKWIQFHLEKGKVGEKQLVAEAEMKNMHTPAMHIASQMSSNDQSHSNYGLGWFISMYRGHKLVEHGGGIDGFTTSTSFLPFDNIGVFVVNNAASQISGQIALYATDLMLDLEPIDRYAKMKANQKKAKEGESEKKEEERINGTRPTHSLKDYAGQYEHPGYGMFSIEFKDESLSGKYNMFDFELEHFHYDVFQTTDEIAFGKMKLSFTSNLKGDINKLKVQLEPAVDEIVFTKKPSSKFSETSYLNKFVGNYKIGEMIIQVSLKNNVLFALPTGQPTIELVPNKENEFSFKGLAGYSTKFVLENGKTIEMILNQPNGVFTAKRVE
jgi:CubicO group peptidase (beta-lactamase class C family)